MCQNLLESARRNDRNSLRFKRIPNFVSFLCTQKQFIELVSYKSYLQRFYQTTFMHLTKIVVIQSQSNKILCVKQDDLTDFKNL